MVVSCPLSHCSNFSFPKVLPPFGAGLWLVFGIQIGYCRASSCFHSFRHYLQIYCNGSWRCSSLSSSCPYNTCTTFLFSHSPFIFIPPLWYWHYHCANTIHSYCCCSVTKLYLTLSDPMECSMPASLSLTNLLEFAHSQL